MAILPSQNVQKFPFQCVCDGSLTNVKLMKQKASLRQKHPVKCTEHDLLRYLQGQ